MQKRKFTDAHEPNAGSDFHVVWAVRKCLGLLNFDDDGLKSVAIESLDPIDSNFIDADGDMLLGVDLTEYYGSQNFKDAKQIIVSQLKYSTRHPEMEWTASKITTGKKGQTGSLIHRLATIFKAFYLKYPRDLILGKLKLKLVSNRPISDIVLSIVGKAKQVLLKTKGVITINALKKHLTVNEILEFNKLFNASKLKGVSVVDFISLLDFSDCSADARFLQRQRLFDAISNLGAFDAKIQFNSLYVLVNNKTMPEAKGNNFLTKEDVLLEFGFPDILTMFPVPEKIEIIKDSVEREQMTEIIHSICLSSRNKITCLHGGAGIGKSTIAKTLNWHFPLDSIVVLFDCYGGGSYADPDDKRHRHEKALLHICNEMALKTGSPFLIRRGENEEFYIAEFKRRILIVSEILLKSSSEAFFILVIDAADNSIAGAIQYEQRSFVQDLIEIEYPENVRLVFTTRTNRLSSLSLKPLSNLITIKSFNEFETGCYLKLFLWEQTRVESKEFMILTNGIPRVMSYTLESEGMTLQEKMSILKPGGKTLEDIFMQLVENAEKKSGDKLALRKLLTFIVLLPKPIPLKSLLEITGLNKEFVEDFAIDIWKGLVFENDFFRFKDEDFENFLGTRFVPNIDDYDKIATIFLFSANEDDYASIHVGYFLFQANRIKELQEIVLTKAYLKLPHDSLKNRETFIERARIAMKNSASTNDRLTFLKLQAVAAEASKTNTILEQIMIGSPELATLFGNSLTTKKLFLQTGNPQWYGRMHLRNAAIFSREKTTLAQAEEHLKNAESWIRFRNGLEDVKRKEYDISEQDIAFGGEAYLRLHGIQKCIRWLSSWEPKIFVFKSINIFINVVLSTSSNDEINNWLGAVKIRFDIQLLINQVLFEKGLVPPFKTSIKTKIDVVARIKSKIKLPLLESLVSYSEQLASRGEIEQSIFIVDLIGFEQPQILPNFNLGSSFVELNKMDLYLKTVVLKSITLKQQIKIDDLLPPKLNVPNENFSAEEKESIKKVKDKLYSFYKHLLPIYELRGSAILGKTNLQDLEKELALILQALERDFDLRYHYRYDAKNFLKFIVLKILDVVFHIPTPCEIIKILCTNIQHEKKENISILLEIAEKLSFIKKYYVYVFDILDDIDKKINQMELAGSTQIDHYKKATILASRISEVAGKVYFDKMVIASSEIDIEAHDQIKCLANITRSMPHLNDPAMAFEFTNFVEYCAKRLKEWEDFPWDDAISGITMLDSISAFAVACRWDHSNLQKLDKRFIDILLLSLKNGVIGHKQAAGLLPINIYYWESLKKTLEQIVRRFDSTADYEGKNLFIEDVIRDIKLNCDEDQYWNFISDFLALIKSGKFLNEQMVNDYKSYCKKLDLILNSAEKEKPHRTNNILKKIDKDKNNDILKGFDITSVKDIEELLHKNGIKRTDYRNFDTDEILSEFFKMAEPKEYCLHLDALVDISPDILGYWSFECAIEQRLKVWGMFPEVKIWKSKSFKKVIGSRFSHFIKYDDYFTIIAIKKLASLFEISTAEFSGILVAALPNFINDLSASTLYQLFEITVAGVSTADKISFIEWLLPKWNENIKPQNENGISNRAFPPRDVNLAIAKFLRYNLGHSDKRRRWRAANSVVRLVTYEQSQVLDILLLNQNERNCNGFQYEPYIFFWIPSKLWLWVAIDRLVSVKPEIMKRYAITSFEELLNEELPHAQIQLFIKSVCLSFDRSFKKLYSPTQLGTIKKVLKSPFKTLDKKKTQKKVRKNNNDFRFDFDSLDTIDHWYEPLGRIFNFSGHEIGKLAEKYICEKWGYVGDLREDDYVVSDDYHLTRHYKSEIPTVENLRTYFEYHALQCVAGELIKTTPISYNEYSYQSWDEWLNEFGLVWDNQWLSDFKDPVPAHTKFWNKDNFKDDWEWNIQKKDFDECIGFSNTQLPGYIVVNSHVKINYYKDYENQNISSALVNPKLAPSLLKTLQTCDWNGYYFHLDTESQDYIDESDDILNEKLVDKFSMVEMVKSLKPEKGGIDDLEAIGHNVNKIRYVLGSNFTDWANLKFSADKRFSYLNQDLKNPVSILEDWSNESYKEGYDSFSCKGQRLFIKVDRLLKYLAAHDLALVINCELYRRPDSKDYKHFYSYYNMFYIIYPNGKVETISRNFKIG